MNHSITRTIRIVKCTDRTVWTSFFNEAGSPSFLHSWEWAELQEKLGHQVLRLSIQTDRLIGIALCIIIQSKRGSFIFLPHGPIIAKDSSQNTGYIFDNLLHYLKSVAKERHCDFIRVAPIILSSKESLHLFRKLGFVDAPIYMHAERVWQLDVTPSEDQLLAAMRKTTRYSIRKAQKLAIRVEKNTDLNQIDIFWSLYQKTAQREGFVPFSKQYIADEFAVFHKAHNALFISAYEGIDCTASALVIFTQSTAFYHQGATLHSKLPTSYLLQWEAIKEARKRGCRYYNFWGVHRPKRTPQDWRGLSLFKEGFGGNQIDFMITQDYILTPKYYLSYLYDMYLKWKRGISLF